MKAITLQDNCSKNPTPWCSMIEYNVKTIETRRNWMNRSHRGDTLFTASANSRTPNAGLAVCVANIYDIVPMTEAHEEEACIKLFEFGWALMTKDLRWLSRKFPVKGMLGIFEVDLPADVTFRQPLPEELRPQAMPAYLRDFFLKAAHEAAAHST